MKRTGLIRLGGLAVMVGGVSYTALSLAVWLSEPPFSRSIPYLDSASDLRIQTLVNLFEVFLVLGALAAIATLHVLHREFYGRAGMLVSVIAFVGVTLLLVVGLGDVLRSLVFLSSTQLTWGFVSAVLGGMGLGIVTIAARVLPLWCGVALMVGSIGFGPALLLGELFAALVGAAWALAGFAIVRARARPSERSSRVR